MSSGGQRPPANRMTLQTFKARLGGAQKGFKLLKKKRDALKAKFQLLLRDIVDTKLQVGQGLRDAAFSLAKANWANAGDDITAAAVERARRPSILCRLVAENVAGVGIPVFRMSRDATEDASVQTLGVAHGGAVISACRETYAKAVALLVRLASLQTAFKTLDEEIKMTSRRVNALEYVLIPRVEDVIQYITQEMDEQAREEFFRVKKVVEKKKAKLERERLQAESEATATGRPLATRGREQALDVPSTLDAAKDSDLVF
uniref:V-type proton ATPase subunit D n=1 Tax=Alexandrium monilatum TaxID=311494 RepID=A0A7S4QD35_9DINO